MAEGRYKSVFINDDDTTDYPLGGIPDSMPPHNPRSDTFWAIGDSVIKEANSREFKVVRGQRVFHYRLPE